jgi:hypothetical protein
VLLLTGVGRNKTLFEPLLETGVVVDIVL